MTLTSYITSAYQRVAALAVFLTHLLVLHWPLCLPPCADQLCVRLLPITPEKNERQHLHLPIGITWGENLLSMRKIVVASDEVG